MKHEQVVMLHAPADRPLYVWFEPWADGIEIPAGTSIEVRATASLEGELEIETAPECMAVYGWAGSTIRVIADGEVVRSFDEPFPPMPSGMSTKAFLGMVLGHPSESGAAAVEVRPKPC